ncbi:hypothetical protein LPJ59_000504 [Coemansia sp. RSA 2399]|nr:hypothetical protein LPJ59_000504 [Coemansia sp. RSA 2399]KAJ1908010.1 hypothetical protein LPJ81_000384 [Coemansia sp. IMI 209127]
MTTTLIVKLALFSGSVSATGNTIAQYFDLWSNSSQRDRNKSRQAKLPDLELSTAKEDMTRYDPVQTLRFFVYGLMFTPIAYRWHAFLNTRFPLRSQLTEVAALSKPAQSASSRIGMVLKRVAVDQAIFAPFACGAFVVGMGVLEGQGPKDLLERIRLQYPKVLLAGYVLWPAAQLVNFSLVPLSYRVPFGSVVSLFWNTYLSWENAQARRQQKALHESQPKASPADVF